jgi:hypothetical protein
MALNDKKIEQRNDLYRRIRELKRAKLTNRQIVDRLNQAGVKTVYGKRITKSNLSHLITHAMGGANDEAVMGESLPPPYEVFRAWFRQVHPQFK